jgi:hypothetical protein
MIAANTPADGSATQILRTRWLAVSAFCTLSFAFLLAFAAGCGPTERQRVQTVSDQFLDAMSQEDWNRAKPLLTEKAREAMGSINPFPQNSDANGTSRVPASPRIANYTIGEPNIDDTAAVIPVTLTYADQSTLGTLRLRRENGEWRVGALRIEGGNDAPGITLDFENPQAALLEATFRAVGEGVGEILKGVGKGMGAFLQGVEKGVAAMEKPEGSGAAEGAGSPVPSPGSDGTVDIKEQTGGS